MIHHVFDYLSKNLNEYICAKYNLSEDIVSASGLIGLDGSISLDAENKVVLTLVHIEKATEGGSYSPMTIRSGENGYKSRGGNATPLNLYMLVSAYFGSKNYQEALKFISEVVGFFQKKPVFNQQNSPGIDPSIVQLNFEIVDTKVNDMVSLWGTLGNHMLPSILYKVRSITIDPDAPISMDPIVTDVDSQLGVR